MALETKKLAIFVLAQRSSNKIYLKKRLEFIIELVFSSAGLKLQNYNHAMDRSHPVILKFFEKFRLKRREASSHDEDELPPDVLSLCRPLPANVIII